MPKSSRAKAEAAEAAKIAKVTKAVHLAAARALRQPKLPLQAVKLKSGSGGGMTVMEGKISPPIQPSYYVAVIIPVYGKISPPDQP